MWRCSVGQSRAGAQFRGFFATQHASAVKAKTAYQDFLALWKDADPDIPLLHQAKAAYAKLQ